MGTIRHSIAAGLRALFLQPFSTVLAVGCIALSLLLAGTVWLASRHLAEFSSNWARGVVVAVYLKPRASAEEIRRVRIALKSLPGVARIRFVSQKGALGRLKENLGADARQLHGVEAAWLPPSFQVTLKGSAATLLKAQQRVASLGRALVQIEEVRTLEKWQRKLHSIAELVMYVGSVLLVLTLITCAYVVAVTVRLGMLARREELRVQRLLGATRWFVAAPMLVEGAFKALVGSVAAVGLLYGVHAAIMPRIMELVGPGPAGSALKFLSWSAVAWAVALTTAAGLLGSRLAIGRDVHA